MTPEGGAPQRKSLERANLEAAFQWGRVVGCTVSCFVSAARAAELP